MNNLQMYFAIGLPTLTALIGILVNIGYFVSMNGRMNRIEDRLDRVMEPKHEID